MKIAFSVQRLAFRKKAVILVLLLTINTSFLPPVFAQCPATGCPASGIIQ